MKKVVKVLGNITRGFGGFTIGFVGGRSVDRILDSEMFEDTPVWEKALIKGVCYVGIICLGTAAADAAGAYIEDKLD